MRSLVTEGFPTTWQVAPGRVLSLDQPRLMGILNVTPDSFSDGGVDQTIADSVCRAVRMVQDGACIIDVGGESTRPGSQRVTAAEQIERTQPVIAHLRAQDQSILISIDTTLSEVARAALDAGADIINDVSAGRDDDAMFALAAKRQAGILLMHRRVRPEQDRYSDQYDRDAPQADDIVLDVAKFLNDRVHAAETEGIERAAIVIDPGLGFGKTVEQNFELIARSGELAALGCPLLSAASRKSFIGAVTGQQQPGDRLAGSVAVALSHFQQGVRLFRVHDVAAHREALEVAGAIAALTPNPVK